MQCQKCGIEIEHRGMRKYCNECRQIVDDERYKNHKKESKDEKIQKLERRIADLEELLTQYDPDRNNSLDDNQK